MFRTGHVFLIFYHLQFEICLIPNLYRDWADHVNLFVLHNKVIHIICRTGQGEVMSTLLIIFSIEKVCEMTSAKPQKLIQS